MHTAFVIRWRNRIDVMADQLEAEYVYPTSNVGFKGSLLEISQAPGYDLVVAGKMRGTGYGYWVEGNIVWTEAAVAEALAHQENKPGQEAVQNGGGTCQRSA